MFKDDEYKLDLIEQSGGWQHHLFIVRENSWISAAARMWTRVKQLPQLQAAASIPAHTGKAMRTTRCCSASTVSASRREEELEEHLQLLEEAKKRDHKKLGRELGLFMMSEYAAGMPDLFAERHDPAQCAGAVLV